jgi:hypothetical protein
MSEPMAMQGVMWFFLMFVVNSHWRFMLCLVYMYILSCDSSGVRGQGLALSIGPNWVGFY